MGASIHSLAPSGLTSVVDDDDSRNRSRKRKDDGLLPRMTGGAGAALAVINQ
jgi:hypothetical protein